MFVKINYTIKPYLTLEISVQIRSYANVFVLTSPADAQSIHNLILYYLEEKRRSL